MPDLHANLLREYSTDWQRGGMDRLLHNIGDARIVLLGEASHGTREFYELRAAITDRLIRQKNFNAVVVEADWPDAYQVTRYIRRLDSTPNADEALAGFKRFPTWMWRNHVVLKLADTLRKLNDDGHIVGFYGMDLYSLYNSTAAVLEYLDTIDPEAARRARDRYDCFEPGDDPENAAQRYGYRASVKLDDCREEAIAQLVEMQKRRTELVAKDGRLPPGEHFFAEQNARLVVNAERYYRTMYSGGVSSWNLRDTHMSDTIDALADHLMQMHNNAKLVVWAHNSHLGDARHTQMGDDGEHNVGQLMRQRHGDAVFNLGFTTFDGTVTAADHWGEPPAHKAVRPALPGSWEHLLHHALGGDSYIPMKPLRVERYDRRLERAIGVIYRPQTERQSHYFEADLPQQFDAVIHLDRTNALEPLEYDENWRMDEPEAYPTGL